jgi:hypothetical protein
MLKQSSAIRIRTEILDARRMVGSRPKPAGCHELPKCLRRPPLNCRLCLAQDLLYVRRVAILLQLLGPRFAHQSISVFSTFALFQQINPVVKAPSLVCDDGEILMGSTLIIECAEVLAAPRKSLMADAIGKLLKSR